MQAKALEIRDRMTFVAALAVEMGPGKPYPNNANLTLDELQVLLDAKVARAYLLRRCGYSLDGPPMIMLTRLDGDAHHATTDPYVWNDRTFKAAHLYITKNWATLKDGDVIDVEFILGETAQPKVSERETVPV